MSRALRAVGRAFPFMSAMAYRKDIDGLRAVAVLSVVAYHISATALAGGYLGVDIFFVLSGYLITQILFQEMLGGKFSIVRFYDRRIRRLMPALLAMLAVVSVVALKILLPADLLGFARSLIATLTFSANIYFWRDTDYFSRAAEEKPLLHLWSLGVEEQFYILFPLLLMLTIRYWKGGALLVVGALVVVSLFANILLNLVGGSNPAFFLLPSRMWELGMGALLAIAPLHVMPRGRTAEAAGIAGAVLVALSLAGLSGGYAFMPAAVPAVIGTCLLIAASMRSEQTAGKLLSLTPVVFIGRCSYSLYLWHWPILVFPRYYLVRDLTLLETGLALLAMFALAAASLHWIERPFRTKQFGFPQVFTFATVGVSVMAAVSAVILIFHGLPQRLPTDAAQINRAVGTNFRCGIADYRLLGKSRACALNLPTDDPRAAELVVFGNSHAQMYAPLVRKAAKAKNVSALLVPMNGCVPLVKVNVNADCMEMARDNLAEILALPDAKTVVIGLDWNLEGQSLFDASNRRVADQNLALEQGLDDLIDRIESSGRSVVLVGPIATPGYDIASKVSRQRAFGRPWSQNDFVASSNFYKVFGPLIDHFGQRLGTRFLRPDTVLCDPVKCHFLIDNHSMFADSNHIAEAELPRFEGVFNAMLPSPTDNGARSAPGAANQ